MFRSDFKAYAEASGTNPNSRKTKMLLAVICMVRTGTAFWLVFRCNFEAHTEASGTNNHSRKTNGCMYVIIDLLNTGSYLRLRFRYDFEPGEETGGTKKKRATQLHTRRIPSFGWCAGASVRLSQRPTESGTRKTEGDIVRMLNGWCVIQTLRPVQRPGTQVVIVKCMLT